MDSPNGWFTVVFSWTFVVGLAYFLYRHYTNDNRKKPRQGRQDDKASTGAQSAAAAPKKKADKALKPRPRPKAVTPAASTNNAFTSSVEYDREADDAANKDLDREFARQLANAKAGTKFNATKSEDKRQKSVKQSKAEQVLPLLDDKMSAPSSTTGDADDDMSPVTSPAVAAVDGRDVSDMLEKPAAGPSVLRLTDTDSVTKPKERKAKAPEVVETKKQRQNRRKAQQAKELREQEEAERKVKMEAQRRQARIADGRAAKDGSAFMAKKENAWTSGKVNGSSSSPTVQPLDTFGQKLLAETTNQSTPKPTTTSSGRSEAWMSDLPSEEEQLRRLQEESNEWNEVPSRKKKGKKSKELGADGSANSTSVENDSAPKHQAPAKVPVNGGVRSAKPALSSGSSFAALTPDESADDVEEEWEV